MLLFAASAASSVLRSKTLKLTGFTPGNLSQIRGPRRIRDSLGCGTERQKSASVPRQWDESACLRGATHVRRDISSHPLCSCYGERAVDVSIPAGRAVFPGFRSVGRFQPRASFSVRRMAWYSCSVIAVFVTAYSTIVSQIAPNVNRLRSKTGKFRGSYSIKIQQGCSGREQSTRQRLEAALRRVIELQQLTSLGG